MERGCRRWNGMPQNAIWVLCPWKVGEKSAKNTPACEKEAARQAENKIHPAAVHEDRKQSSPEETRWPPMTENKSSPSQS